VYSVIGKGIGEKFGDTMKLYQFVLDVDRERDLTHPERGRDWAYFRVWIECVFDGTGRTDPDPQMLQHGTVKTLRAVTRCIAGFNPNPPAWKELVATLQPVMRRDDEELERENWFDAWARNVRALRSLVGRLDDAKTRPPGIKAHEADDILRAYLALPVAAVLDVRFPTGRDSPSPRGRSLSREQGVGLKILAGKLGPVHGYWQDVFLSLVDERHAGARLCQVCNEPFELTEKLNKPTRRMMCKSCQMKAWYADVRADDEKREALRERNRANKAKQRKRDREAKQRKSGGDQSAGEK
jgi:hypothetical protein